MQYDIFTAAQFLAGEDISVVLSRTSDQVGMHVHDFIEFAYVHDGCGYHIVDGEKVSVRPGDFFLFNAYVPHAYKAQNGSTIVMYDCIFRPECIDRSLEDGDDFLSLAYAYLLHTLRDPQNPRSYLRFTGVESKKIRDLLEDMYAECQEKNRGYKQMLHASLIRLLILAFRMYREDAAQGGDTPVLKKLTVQNALQYMKRAYASPITGKQLADRAYLSLSYFNKIFREETGTSPLRMLQAIRLEEACRLLRESRLPTTEVAAAVGYADAKFFYKLFRQHTGVTPGKYRTTVGAAKKSE